MARDENGDVLQTREQMLRGLEAEEHFRQRAIPHLRGMADAGMYTFFDHELAAFMRRVGWVYCVNGSCCITEAGRAALRGGKETGE